MALPKAKHRLEVNDSPAKYRIKPCTALSPYTVVKSVECSQSCIWTATGSHCSHQHDLWSGSCNVNAQPAWEITLDGAKLLAAVLHCFPQGRLRLRLSLSRLFPNRGLFTARAVWLAGSLLQVPFCQRKDESERAKGSERRQMNIKMP